MAVFRQAEVNAGEIRLDDVAQITGEDPRLVRKLQKMGIGRSPLPGKSRGIEEAHIVVRLKQAEIDPSRVAIKVPEGAEVVRGFEQVSKEEVKRVVRDFIRQAAALQQGKTRVKGIQFDRDIIVPKGALAFRVEPPQNRMLCGRVPLAVSISVNGKVEKKVWAVADIEVLRKVIVAGRPLGKHHRITEDDIQVREMDMAGLSAKALTDERDVVGKRTRKAIAVNTVLRADMVELPPLVKRGDVVTVVAEGAGLRITVLGVVKERRGRKGEMILVENLDSNKAIYARVIDSKTVKVDF